MIDILLNKAFLLFWSILVEIHRELKGANTEENLDLFKQLFLIKQLKGINIKRNVFIQKVSHILLNYAFQLFFNLFEKIHRELFFLNIKVTIWKTSTEILREFVFLTMFERDKPEENFNLFKQLFLIKEIKGDK